jgi:homoserine dehydrogenase
MATASAVVADIGDIARGCAHRRSGGHRPLAVSRKAPMQRHEGGYYIRLLARDRPGTAATIARALPAGDLARIDRAAPLGRAWRRPSGQDGRPGSGHPDHLCDDRGCGAQGPCGGAARQGDIGAPQVIRIEKN